MRLKWPAYVILFAMLAMLGLCALIAFNQMTPRSPQVFNTSTVAPVQQPTTQSSGGLGTSTSVPTVKPPTVIAVQPTAVIAQPGQNLPVVKVGFDTFSSYLTVVVAKQLGLDVKNGIQIELIPFYFDDGANEFDEAARSAAMASGEWDILFTTVDKLKPNPQIGAITTVIDETAGSDQFVCNSSVTNLNDLRGKRVAFAEGSVGQYMAYFVLDIVKLNPTDVQLLPKTDVAEAVAAYLAGEADCVSAWQPDIDEAVAAGGRVILDSGRLRVPIDVIVTSNNARQNRGDQVLAFHTAWYEALKLVVDQPEVAEKAIMGWGHPDWTYVAVEGDLAFGLETIAQASFAQNQAIMSNPRRLVSRLDESAAVWSRFGVAVPQSDSASLVDDRFVKVLANSGKDLQSVGVPVNDTFSLTSTSELPALTAEELGQAQVLAVLPFEKVNFQPESSRLTPQAQKDILEQILPVLLSSTTLYVRIEGSAAWPAANPPYTREGVMGVASDRAQSVFDFLVVNGVSPSRIIMGGSNSSYPGAVEPAHPNSSNPNEWEGDRFVRFTLITAGR